MSGPRLRFAPSPTGDLHVGNIRTLLFCWAYARHEGGTLILRLEDTDRARSTEESYQGVLADIRWLGLDWDGDVVFQYARADRHREVAESLLASGNAYHCYATPEELTQTYCRSFGAG